VLIQGPYP
jgi:hypothetical protein